MFFSLFLSVVFCCFIESPIYAHTDTHTLTIWLYVCPYARSHINTVRQWCESVANRTPKESCNTHEHSHIYTTDRIWMKIWEKCTTQNVCYANQETMEEEKKRPIGFVLNSAIKHTHTIHSHMEVIQSEYEKRIHMAKLLSFSFILSNSSLIDL